MPFAWKIFSFIPPRSLPILDLYVSFPIPM